MKADGLILLGYGDYLAYEGKLEKLVAQGTRFVRWGAVLPDQPGLSIGCDNFHGGRLAGQHLVGLGRRRIAFLGGASSHCPEFFDRFRGCDAALREVGGAMEAILEAKKEGKLKWIGFSAHTTKGALEAMKGFKFDTVMFPINFVEYYTRDFGKDVLALVQEQGAAVLAKALPSPAW